MENKAYVYFLSVDWAQKAAARHEREENWDLWTDGDAIISGFLRKREAEEEAERRVS